MREKLFFLTLLAILPPLVAGPAAAGQERRHAGPMPKSGSPAARPAGILALLRSEGIVVGDSSGDLTRAVELRVIGTAVGGEAAHKGTGSFRVASRRRDAGALPKHRSARLSRHSLLVVVVDSRNSLLGWTIVPDPRVLRAELPGEDGRLAGKVVVRENVEFVVAVPDSGSAHEVLFFTPGGVEGEADLTLLGRMPLD